MSRLACGIDLGTTNSAVAYVAPGGAGPELAPTPEGERLTPSLVHVGASGAVLVGAEARRGAEKDPAGFFEHWKRDLGDPHWSRAVGGRAFTPVLLSSFVLRRLLGDVLRATGELVREAVVAVPAYFGELERGATVDAGRVAGLEKVHTINEPTAAALSYGLDPEGRSERPRRAVVYDLGGGTFDVTVVELARGRVRVLATAGEPRLGGKDWDDELLNLVAEEVAAATGKDAREDERTLLELRRRVERAKHELSLAPETMVQVPLAVERRTFPCRVTREQLEARTRGLLEQTETQLAVVLDKAKLRWSDVDVVLPTGGATRMPAVRELLRRCSGKAPLQALDPDTAVARGAAVYAALLARGASLAVEGAPDESSVVGFLPPAAGALVDPAEEDAEDDPGDDDAATAGGELRDAEPASVTAPATREAGGPAADEELPLLPGERRVAEVEDVVTHALGVLCVSKKKGWKNVVLIPDQTAVPVSRAKRFKTVRNDQTAVSVKVLEGSGTDPEACTLVGTLVVDGLPPGRPRGQRVEVVYALGEDGRLTVSARDVATGKQARATIERRGALAPGEIERLRREVATRVRT